jgi:uncharacterized linocin/CFP29 family protein
MEAQVDWNHEQWSQVKQTVLDEATKVSVAGSFLSCYGPMERSATVVRAEMLSDGTGDTPKIWVDDVETLKLCTLTIYVQLKHQQLSEDNLTGALSAFRRAANLLARAEDAIVFNGLPGEENRDDLSAIHVPAQCRVTGGQETWGLVINGLSPVPPISTGRSQHPLPAQVASPHGENLVTAVAETIATLEGNGHYGPFACVLGTTAFVAAHTPSPSSLVLPRDRMEPLLGMSLLRSSTLEPNQLVVVALAGDPIDLAVATAPTVQFLNVTDEAKYLFRVYEKFVLRVKETGAVRTLTLA